MLPTIIVVVTIVSIIALWIISIQRRLVVLDENVSNTMRQIGVQVSSRFDVLMDLINIITQYAQQEGETLLETAKSKRCLLTPSSKPDDVECQEVIITDVLGRIALIRLQYPKIKENQNYINTMNAIQTFEHMVRTSRMIYNDSVSKLNKELRMFPVSMIGRMLGFSQREYLVEKVDIKCRTGGFKSS